MKNTKKHWLLLTAGLTIAAIGCKKDAPENTNPNTAANYESGVFIVNEGKYTGGSGTISFYNRNTGVVSNDIFATANGGASLGNIAQSMSIYNGKGYILVTNKGTMEVVNPIDFKSIASVSGLTLPRYFLGIDNTKAYVSEWGLDGNNGAIKVINLSNNTISSTINTGKGAENMIKINNLVYVTCTGAYDKDSVVTVINSNTDAVETTINVGPNPNSLQVDANGKLWVLCSGQLNSDYTALAKTGKLVRINPSTNTVEESFSLPSTYVLGSSRLNINKEKNKLFFIYSGGVYSHEISAVNFNSTSLINRNFYGLGIDPVSNYIYASNAGDYNSNGWVIRYTNSGSKVDSFQVGIAPNGFFFK